MSEILELFDKVCWELRNVGYILFVKENNQASLCRRFRSGDDTIVMIVGLYYDTTGVSYVMRSYCESYPAVILKYQFVSRLNEDGSINMDKSLVASIHEYSFHGGSIVYMTGTEATDAHRDLLRIVGQLKCQEGFSEDRLANLPD